MVTLREIIKSIKIDVSNDASVGLFLTTYNSYLPEKQVLVFFLRRYIKHSRKCLNTFPNNSKFVTVRLLQPRPPDKILHKLNEWKSWRLTIVSHKLSLWSSFTLERQQNCAHFWIICWKLLLTSMICSR